MRQHRQVVALRLRRWFGGTLLGALVLLGPHPGGAATAPSKDVPFVLSADELTYDSELGLVVASGHVEVWQGDYVLFADTLNYNERTRTVAASGNVALVEPSGTVLFANYMELSDDLREGVIRDVKLLLTDRSRAAAAGGKRTGGTRNELHHAVYSPCALCPEDPTRPPLWQIKAVKVVHDQEEKSIVYRDAWLEIYGVPVLYTPYFSHADPSVKRKSGILGPSVSISDDLGFAVRVPVYWSLGVDRDVTFRPLITTKQGIVLDAEYRQRLVDGKFSIRGSGTVADRRKTEGGMTVTEEDEFRGHLAGLGRFDLNEHWRTGFDVNLASDKTYLRAYDLSDERTLTSRLFAEGFHRRNFASVQSLYFQGLRDGDDNDEQPIIFPKFDYSFVGEPDDNGGYYTIDADAMGLFRVEGRESRRLSLALGWTLPYTAPAGDIYTFSALLRGDAYWFQDVDPASNDPTPAGPTEDGFRARVLPQASFEWRYPLVREHASSREVLEPIAGVVVSPSGQNSGKFPNEDSQDPEFDDTNLFSMNRFGGLDRIDSGQRVNYGVKWGLYGNESGYASAFLGQTYQFNDDNEFMAPSGLEDNLSDVVGRVEISPAEYLDLLYRVRFDTGEGKIDRNEVNLHAGVPEFNADVSYFFLRGDAGFEFGDREEVAARLGSQFTDYWSAFTAGRYDLVEDRLLAYGAGVAYEDECFALRMSATHTRYRDEEIRPETRFELELAFKSLGDIETGF